MIDYKKIESVHTYPAKYKIELIEKYILEYTDEEDWVLDPFVGSGTTLLASRKHSRNSIGVDINPTAIMISKFKTHSFLKKINKISNDEIKAINPSEEFINNYDNFHHWFTDESAKALFSIREFIKNKNKDTRIVLDVALSKILIWASNQESDTRYSAKESILTYDQIINKFVKTFNSILGANVLGPNDTESIVIKSDSRFVNLKSKDIKLLVTSPPYINTYDYYLYHKHRNLWLSNEYKEVKNSEIGSRREFSSKKEDPKKFEEDIYKVFENCDRYLAKKAHIVIVIGDGIVKGETINALNMMYKVGERLGYEKIKVDTIKLDKTSRSFNASHRSKGKNEYWITFKKNK